MSQATIRRLARRGGVERVSGLIYEDAGSDSSRVPDGLVLLPRYDKYSLVPGDYHVPGEHFEVRMDTNEDTVAHRAEHVT